MYTLPVLLTLCTVGFLLLPGLVVLEEGRMNSWLYYFRKGDTLEGDTLALHYTCGLHCSCMIISRIVCRKKKLCYCCALCETGNFPLIFVGRVCALYSHGT
jgi:hypothetical protein